MLLSYVVYLSLMFSMLFCGMGNRKGKSNLLGHIRISDIIIPSFLFSLVFGCRYGVGTDHLDYVSEYLYGSNRDLEIGFSWLETMFTQAGLHFSIFFGFLALVQVLLYFLSLREREFLPFLIIVLMLSCQWLGWCNGIRQSIASCFFLFSIRFIVDRKPLGYFICFLLALSFHKSAIILLPFYLVYFVDLSRYKWVPWAIFILANVIANSGVITNLLNQYFEPLLQLLGYDESYDIDDAFLTLADSGSGWGVVLGYITTVSILLLAPNAKVYYTNLRLGDFFQVIYTLYLVGLFGTYAFPGVVILQRPFGYFTIFGRVLMAMLLYFLMNDIKTPYRNFKFWGLILLLSLRFVAILLRGEINTAEYHVFWEMV